MEGEHAVAGFEFGYVRAHCGHHARGFMSIDAGRRQQIVFDLLEIGVADAASLHADQNFAAAQWRESGSLPRRPRSRRDTRRRA